MEDGYYTIQSKSRDYYVWNVNKNSWFVDPYDAGKNPYKVTFKDLPKSVLKKIPKVIGLLFFDL